MALKNGGWCLARGIRRTTCCSPLNSEFSTVDKTYKHKIKFTSPFSSTTRPEFISATRPEFISTTRPEFISATRPEFISTTRPEFISATRREFATTATRPDLDKKLSTPPHFIDKSPSVAEAEALLPPLTSVNFEPDLVIFDKDGTLVCFHTMWNDWCEAFAERVTQATQKDLQDSVFDAMGYDASKREFRLGMCAEKTNPYVKKKMVELLRYHLVEDAAQVVEKTWQDTPEDMQIKLTGDIRSLFGRLKAKNIKIAICTADSREGTVQFLERMGLVSMVDCLVCGDDPFSKSKPDPHNALHICAELGLEPQNAIMVGDTPADTIMGQAANLGLTVGVLTGVGNKEDLTHADIIVHNVDQVVDLIIPMNKDNSSVTI